MRRVVIENIKFREFLCSEFKNSRHPIPMDIIETRNTAITLSFIEMFCCMGSFGMYARRRSKIILFMIFLTVISTFAGLCAKLRLSWCGLLAHGMFAISVLGGFYIYIIIDSFLSTDFEMIVDADEDQSEENDN